MERQKDGALSDRDGQMIGEKFLVRQIHACTHGSNFTRKTANLELEMFVTGENLLKERMDTKSPRVTTHKRCFEDAKEIIASEAKQDDSLLSV